MKGMIIGAGIAGCATALFFKRAGIEAELYEQRSASDTDAGLFLTLAPNGLRVLDELGLGREVRDEGIVTSDLTFSNGRGRSLGKVSLEDRGHASLTVKRAVLLRILRQELSRQGLRAHFDMKLAGLEVGHDVYARFGNKAIVASQLLVGCDGIHSRVRRTLFPDAPEPAPTGLSSSGGFATLPKLAPTGHEVRMVYGKNAFFGYIVSAAGEAYWFSTFDSSAMRGAWTGFDDALREQLLRLHAEDGQVVCDIIRATRVGGGVFPINDILTLRDWTAGSAVLIGDAAHATSPHGGQGASMALEDAWCLTEALRARSSQESTAQCLERFQRERQPRVEKIVEWSRQRGSGKAPSSNVERWVRDLVMPLALRIFGRPGANAWVYRSPLDGKSTVDSVGALS